MNKAMAQATGSVPEPVLTSLNEFLLAHQVAVFAMAAALLVLLIGVSFRISRKSFATKEATTLTSDAEGSTAEMRQPSTAIDQPVQPTPKEIAKDIAEIRATDQISWLSRLKQGLSKTRHQLIDNLGTLFSGKAKLDDELLEQIHEILFRSDLGVETADSLIEHLKSQLGSQSEGISIDDVRIHLRNKIRDILQEVEQPFDIEKHHPHVILIIGVNGVGKTTSIGKLAAHFMAAEKSVVLGAADTFRAAAIDQLNVWAERIGCEIIKHQAGSDPASVAFDTVKAAVSRKKDMVLIDTAGRLHNKRELMDELGKIRRVISRDIPDAPHETWLVIDATTGQNAIQQIKAFTEVAPLTGLIVTKLDGTAKGGVVISAAEKFKLPIRYIGVGEKAADLRPFRAAEFAESIL